MQTPADRSVDRIRVFLVDDCPLFRRGICAVLAEDPAMEVIGESDNADDAFEQIRAIAPDVVIAEVKLPAADGLSLTRRIRLHSPWVGVIALAASDDEDLLFQCIKVGAAAYYTKNVAPADLLTAIRRVYNGEYLINESVLTRPMVASRVLKQFRDLSLVGQEMEPLFAPLSAREIEILDYIARGNSNKEIARALKISDQTVKNHITSILRKLAVNDRTQAVVLALRKGWIKMTD